MATALGEEKHKVMAVVLHDQFGYTQVSIAKLMGVSPSTISTWINIGRLLIQNKNLINEVEELKGELLKIGYTQIKPLNEEILDVIDIK